MLLYFKVDVKKIESVQRRFTNAIFPNLPYTDRLSQLGLLSLETRRVMADLTTCYKVLNGQIDVNCFEFFTVSSLTHTRGNSRKLIKNHSLTTRNAHVFYNRVVNSWNKLPDSVVQAPSTASFKNICLSLLTV